MAAAAVPASSPRPRLGFGQFLSEAQAELDDARLRRLRRRAAALVRSIDAERFVAVLREWDEDRSGSSDRREFVQALAAVTGRSIAADVAHHLFDSIERTVHAAEQVAAAAERARLEAAIEEAIEARAVHAHRTTENRRASDIAARSRQALALLTDREARAATSRERGASAVEHYALLGEVMVRQGKLQ